VAALDGRAIRRDHRCDMALPPWFHHDPLPDAGAIVALDAAEARHALGSKRVAAGEAIALFDGRGGIADAVIEAARGRGEAVVRVSAVRHVERVRPHVHLAAALAKGDRLSAMLSMAAQLGIASFTPLACEWSVVEEGRNARSRWQRVFVEACKQCRRPWIPEIRDETDPRSLTRGEAAAGSLVVLAHPSEAPILDAIDERAESARDIICLIGPEAGFTDGEVSDVKGAGAVAVSLGEGLLRVETAATAILAIVMCHAHR
jgi:16S rRNA (uracil1498-N3)-methyltransferase